MTLVDEMNLNGVSSLAREVLGLEAEGTDGRSCPIASSRLVPVKFNLRSLLSFPLRIITPLYRENVYPPLEVENKSTR